MPATAPPRGPPAMITERPIAATLLLCLPLEATAATPPAAESLLREAIAARIEAMAREIEAQEASRDRLPLLERKFTVDTFLAVGTLLESLGRGGVPDPLPLWRFDFLDLPRPLQPLEAAEIDSPDASPPAEAGLRLHGAFEVAFLQAAGGDDPVTIRGRVLIDDAGVAILATGCEPCLAPTAVDFPILPEAFLLEWADRHREVRTFHPAIASHRERLSPDPPRLDQPEDLYDLFDGLRPLPWLLAATKPRFPTPASGSAEARDESGRALQRVEWRLDRGETLRDVALARLSLSVEQPPLETRWRSGATYRLDGESGGDAFIAAELRPEGVLLQHPDGASASFEIDTDAGVPREISATIRRGGAIAAKLRWIGLESLGLEEAATVRQRWRRLADDPLAWRSWPAALDGMSDQPAARLHGIRRRLLSAIGGRDRRAMHAAAASWSQELARQGFRPDVELRGWEQLAAWLAARGEQELAVEVALGPWLDAIRRQDPAVRRRLATDRLSHARFAAAMLLALEVGEGDGPLPWWLEAVLLAALGGEATRPVVAWIEPPGRVELDRIVAEALSAFVRDRPPSSSPSSPSPSSPSPAPAQSPTQKLLEPDPGF